MSGFRLISHAWEQELVAHRQAHPDGLRIIGPFVKRDALRRLLDAGASSRIELITRYDLGGFDQGVSDLDALRLVLARGGTVRGVRGLHAKVYLFARASVIATSANLTDAALRRNHEFGFAAEAPDVVAACHEYFDRLWAIGGEDLAASSLDDWQARLDVHRLGSPGRSTNGLPDFGAEAPPGMPLAFSGEAAAFDNQAFIKFSGTARKRARRALAIDGVVADSGANWAFTYPTNVPPRQVRDGDLLYFGRLVYGPDDLMIFGSAVGRAHRDGIDVANEAEIALRPWKAQWRNYVRVHDARFIDATLGDGVSFRAMLHELGADSFAPTQRNAARGKGNTNPFNAHLQKAAMMLTDRSRTWIEERLAAKLRLFGEVDLSASRFEMPGLPLDELDHHYR